MHTRRDNAGQQPDDFYKLNVFALPNQTSVLVVLLVGVTYGTFGIISVSGGPVPIWPLIVGLLLLSLRALLAWPERLFQQYDLVPHCDKFSAIQARITALALAEPLKLRRVPRLVITKKAQAAAAFGSLRRRYIMVGAASAEAMLQQLAEPSMAASVDAILIHELYHFKHGDTTRVEYSRALLRTSIRFIAWAAAILSGWFFFILIAQQTFFRHPPQEVILRFEALLPGLGDILRMFLPSTREWLEAREQASQLDFGLVAAFGLGNTLPFVILSGVTLLVLWRKLLRAQELYADAGVAHMQRDIIPLLVASTIIAGTTPIDRTVPGAVQGRRDRNMFRRRLGRPQEELTERLAYLRDPARIYGTGRNIGVLAGLFVVVLDLLLSGTSALYWVGRWPMHFPVITGFILLSISLIARVVSSDPRGSQVLTMVTIMMLIRGLVVFVSIALLVGWMFLDSSALAGFLDTWISVVAGVASPVEEMSMMNPRQLVVQAVWVNLMQLPVTFLLILGAVYAQTCLTRAILTWYSFPRPAQQLPRLIYGTIGLIACVLALGLVPVTDFVLLRFEQIGGRDAVALLLSMSVVGIGSVWLRLQHRSYARKCPNCREVVPGVYTVGRRCDACGELLHPWLTVVYNTNLDHDERTSPAV